MNGAAQMMNRALYHGRAAARSPALTTLAAVVAFTASVAIVGSPAASAGTRPLAPPQVHVANLQDTSVSVINGGTCNGTNPTSCGNTPTKVAAGNYPRTTATDPTASTGYVTNRDNTVSVIPLTHRCADIPDRGGADRPAPPQQKVHRQ
jgi:hypothetical protein